MGLRDGRRRAAGRRTAGWAAVDARAIACLAIALLVLGGSLGLVLSRTAQHRSGTNGVWPSDGVLAVGVPAGATACQEGELLPAGTGMVQIQVYRAPRLGTVSLWQRRRLLDRVTATFDARAGLLRAPIARTTHDVDDVRVCLTFRSRAVLYQGVTLPDVGGVHVGGGSVNSSMAIDYLQPGRPSWWQEIPAVAARIDLGRGDWGGGSIAWLIAALVAASLALAGWVVVRTIVTDRGTSRIAWTIMAIAVFNAAAWSIITPAFQAPDEGGHIAYVQSIGETGAPPTDPRQTIVSPELIATMVGTRFGDLRNRSVRTAVWSPPQQRRLAAHLRARVSRRATTFLGPAEPEPPLYYTLEAIPYRLGYGATLLDRIALMRLLSALLAGLTALLAFLFVRECLPARPWAWAVGGLGVAFMPMLGFIGGSVNPDALLFVLAAALFLCLARAWRRGVAMPIALWVGALIAAGMLAKVNYYALVPGAFLALALAARRSEGAWGRGVVRLLGAAAVVAAAGFAIPTVLEVLVWHRPFAIGRPPAPESHVGLLSHLSYIWQVFLPRLPFQARAFPDVPLYSQLFKTFVGVFGSLQVWFPGWVYRLAAALLAGTGLLAVRALAADPRTLRWRRRELLGYAVMTGAMLALIGLSADMRRSLMPILQGRYLLPLLPLFGALLVLGARGAGERWGRAVGVAIVVTAVAGTLFGQLATIAFFYS